MSILIAVSAAFFSVYPLFLMAILGLPSVYCFIMAVFRLKVSYWKIKDLMLSVKERKLSIIEKELSIALKRKELAEASN